MSRSGYSDDCCGAELGLWRGAVESAIRGNRGQQFLRETLAALDAMPEKRLIASALVAEDGCVCTMGATAKARGIDTSKVDPEDRDAVARALNIAPALAAEIAFRNDEEYSWRDPDNETPERRWERMRKWVADHILPLEAPNANT